MKTSLKGRLALAASEGVVTTAYRDSVGVWTLGIGHTKSAGSPDPKAYIGREISIPDILEIFERDLKVFEKIVNSSVRVPLKQHEFDALVHFVYNIGGPGFKKSKLLQNLNAGNKNAAWQSGFHGWLKPIELRGRRDKERKMAQTGDYGKLAAALFSANSSGKLIRKGTIDLTKYLSGSSVAEGIAGTGIVGSDTKVSGFIKTLISLLFKLFGRK